MESPHKIPLHLIYSFTYYQYLLLFESSPEDMLINFIKRGRERERDKYQCEKETLISCFLYASKSQFEPTPSYVPSLGIEPTIFSVWDNTPNNWGTHPGPYY